MKILGIRDLLGYKAITHRMRTGHMHGRHTSCVHENRMVCACGQQYEEKDFPVFLSMFFNGWVLIWEYPYHMYEFQISRFLFYNGF